MSQTKSRKIRPQLGLKPNTDSNAMLRALHNGAEGDAPPAESTIAPLAPVQAADSGTSPRAAAEFKGRADSTEGLVPGSTYELPLSLLARSDNNARVYYNPGEVEEIAQSLAEKGQDVPVVGYVKGQTVVIIDGQKRFNACTLGKLPTLKVFIRPSPATDAEEYEASRRTNLERSTQTSFDDAVRWQDLLARRVYPTQEDLAHSLKTTTTAVSKTLALNRIPNSLRRMMADNKPTSSLGVAYEISSIFSKADDSNIERLEAIAEEVIGTVIKKGLTRDQTIELVRSKLEGPKTRVRGDNVPVKFGTHKGAIKMVPSRGEFSLSFRGIPADEFEELKRRVEAGLAGQMSI